MQQQEAGGTRGEGKVDTGVRLPDTIISDSKLVISLVSVFTGYFSHRVYIFPNSKGAPDQPAAKSVVVARVRVE